MKPHRSVNAGLILVLVLSAVTTTGFARQKSPFTGAWRAIDPGDGSAMRLAIGGPPGGPFRITWTEDYFSLCDGEAGIGRGTGSISGDDPFMLEAHLVFECFTTGMEVPYDTAWLYHPITDSLAQLDGYLTTWRHPGKPASGPALGLRVNYGHDWAESFYEAGHVVRVTVTESDRVTIKATAEFITEPKDFWGGEPGFASQASDWDPAQPDIQPFDWVYGIVDNGQTAQVQIGEIAGTINPGADSIMGTIAAPWFAGEVNVECFPWGAPETQPDMKFDAVLPDGGDPYACSWAGEWDVLPYQDVGVGFFGLDGHWVANAFFAGDARIVASAAGDWFWTTAFNPGQLTVSIHESQDTSADPLWQGFTDADDSGFVFVGYEVHGVGLLPGHYLVISDGATQKGLVIETITMETFDTEVEFMAGTAPSGREVLAVAGMAEAESQARIPVVADSVTGAWQVDFTTVDFDITEEMRPWSFAQVFDADGDANEAGVPPPPPGTGDLYAVPDENRIWANGWIEGLGLRLTIFELDGSMAYSEVRIVPPPSQRDWTEVLFESGFELEPEQRIVIRQGGYERELMVSSIRVTGFDLGAQTVFGTGDPGVEFFVGIGGADEWGTVEDDGTWSVHSGNLAGGVWGSAIQPDEDGDSTRDIFAAPNPNFYAVPDENRIYANEWTEGSEVRLTVFDPDGRTVYSESRVVAAPSEVPWTLEIFVPDVPLVPGQRIVLNQGGYERELMVSSIRVTGFALGTQTIFGTGDPGAKFFVRIGGVDAYGTVGGDGTWSVQHPNLAGEVWGEAIQPDGDGDATRDGFQAPTM